MVNRLEISDPKKVDRINDRAGGLLIMGGWAASAFVLHDIGAGPTAALCGATVVSFFLALLIDLYNKV